MTGPVRQRTWRAVHASWTTGDYVAAVTRSLAIAAAVAIVLSFVGAFGTGDEPFIPRTLVLIGTFCAGSMLGLISFNLAGLIPPLSGRLWWQALGGGVIMTAPMAGLLWSIAAWAYGARAANAELGQILLQTAVLSLAMTFLSVALNRGAMAMTHKTEIPPRFLDRLPPKLKGAELYAVEAEDHYLRLHTSKGQDLILMRLSDAIAELEGLEGAQAHRSWWVARAAIADARRTDGRAELTLTDGSVVPVSRTHARKLREAGWI